MPIPKGVTVYPSLTAIPARTTPRNAIERAAQCEDVEMAKRILCELLGLSPLSPLAAIYLSEPPRWKRLGPSSRLMELGAWLRAECYELMDFVDSPGVDTRGD